MQVAVVGEILPNFLGKISRFKGLEIVDFLLIR